MSTEHLWVAPGDVVTDISGHVELPKTGGDGFQLSTNAEEGSVGSSDLMLDDPDGDLYITGLNAYRARETLSEAADPYLFAGHFGRRKEKRGPYMTGPSRQIAAQVQDANAILSRYVATEDDDADRPQESEEDRMTWLFTISAMVLHFDFATSILDLGSTVMPKADLTGYTVQQIVGEMATMAGKNYYVWWDGVDEEYELVYARDGGDHLTSDLRFSNVETDYDGDTTFYAGLDWELDINPERITSNATVRGANGLVTEIDVATGTHFGRTDRVFDANLIKTDALLSAQALQYLADLDTEELVVSGTVYLPAEKASQFRAGMRCEMKATHLTGMSSFVWVRLLNVTIVNIAEDPTLTYALNFEGTFTPGITCATAIGTLEGFVGDHEGPGFINPMTAIIPPIDGDFLAIACAAACDGGPFTDGGTMVVEAPWTSLPSAPPFVAGTHTESVMGYQSNAAGAVSVDWDYVGFGGAQGSILGVCIPTSATAPLQLTQNNGGTGPNIEFDDPPTPGNMLVLFRVGEGAGGFDGGPGGADWVLVAQAVVPALVNANSAMEIWCACVPDDPDDLVTGSASSSWWTHCIEVEMT